MTQTSDNVTWLTQEAYSQLKAELEYLSGPARTEIAKKIEAAREEGDLRENGGYHAAKEEQGKQELRIRQLQQLLENAKVGEAPADDGVVEPGMVVTIAFDGDEDDTITFLLASREYASADIETYSPQSPLGTGVNGKKVGEDAQYELPNGKMASVRRSHIGDGAPPAVRHGLWQRCDRPDRHRASRQAQAEGRRGRIMARSRGESGEGLLSPRSR
ncbi:transcription elongation factor GreA [Streptomyces albus]